MAYETEKQLDFLTKAYRGMKKLEQNTKDPVIKNVVCDDNDYFAFAVELIEEALKDVLPKQYITNEMEKGEDEA